MEQLKHECGVVMIRLRQPLSYFRQKYGTWQYALNKLYLMMEKQHNRGQEGAGLACVKLHAEAGEEYMYRERAMGSSAITEIFANVHEQIQQAEHTFLKGKRGENVTEITESDIENRMPYAGELYMGHLRYSTTGKSGISFVHPFLRRNNWRARNLCLCGNFNMTNVNAIFDELTSEGQHPRFNADTYIILEQMGHQLDRESERCYKEAVKKGLRGQAITDHIELKIDLANVLKNSSHLWDGGYVICGLTGSGESFSMRDPWGIRPAFYYYDDEIFVLTSERPVIQTALKLEVNDVHELLPGQAILVNQAGEIRLEQIIEAKENKACCFERIYFSRGSDSDIYMERKALGKGVVPSVLQAIDNDVEHTVFSYIPNTAEVSFYGLTEGMEDETGKRIRREKIAWKDIKLRTFITESNSRNDLAAHVYDITYGCVRPNEDQIVVIDDSIVRGTTLRESIIRILDRLHPKRIVIVSSSPQIRYPDYYGIDMSNLSEFIAFKAAVALIKKQGLEHILSETYQLCIDSPTQTNHVKRIYAPFTDEEISKQMAQMLQTDDIQSDVKIVFQTIAGLHQACPHHRGDWYFTGNYPTPGGVERVNQAFIDYMKQTHPELLQ
ncbi:MAG: amidophosphoribosyltransferase [Paludibacteraceae bacterium]|nr:amidophosphoribosyltransferase [Paludibacteraceae bacterium]